MLCINFIKTAACDCISKAVFHCGFDLPCGIRKQVIQTVQLRPVCVQGRIKLLIDAGGEEIISLEYVSHMAMAHTVEEGKREGAAGGKHVHIDGVVWAGGCRDIAQRLHQHTHRQHLGLVRARHLRITE